MTKNHDYWMEKCIRMAEDNVKAGQSPFASIIVKNGEAVSYGVNDAKASFDPTAHGEIRAIQKAGRKLQTLNLSDCVLYTNCEPCPMCLGAIYWSGITEVWYGLSIEAQAEFDKLPKEMYEEFKKTGTIKKLSMKDLSSQVEGRRPFLVKQ
jgi:guanine deaminase